MTLLMRTEAIPCIPFRPKVTTFRFSGSEDEPLINRYLLGAVSVRIGCDNSLEEDRKLGSGVIAACHSNILVLDM